MVYRVHGRVLETKRRAFIMGVLNATPDSIYPPSRVDEKSAAEKARLLVEEGADLLDIGAVSTRPKAPIISEDEEISRLLPVLVAVRKALPEVLISVDTVRPAVAREALKAGALDILNDITCLTNRELALVAKEARVTVILTHARSHEAPPLGEGAFSLVNEELCEAAKGAVYQGVNYDKVWVDPGIGFGKVAAANDELLKMCGELCRFRGKKGLPVLIGVSHKRGFETTDATVKAGVFAVENGANILRVHDVAAQIAALEALESSGIARPSK